MQGDNIVRQSYKQDFKGQRKRGRPLKRWSSHTRNDTGLPLLREDQHGGVLLPGGQRGVNRPMHLNDKSKLQLQWTVFNGIADYKSE